VKHCEIKMGKRTDKMMDMRISNNGGNETQTEDEEDMEDRQELAALDMRDLRPARGNCIYRGQTEEILQVEASNSSKEGTLTLTIAP